MSSSLICTQHASHSAEEESAQAAGLLGFSGPGGSVPGRLQRAVHGVDLETNAGPVSVLQDPAGPNRAGLYFCILTHSMHTRTESNIYNHATTSEL